MDTYYRKMNKIDGWTPYIIGQKLYIDYFIANNFYYIKTNKSLISSAKEEEISEDE